MARQFFIKDKNLKPENIKSGVKILNVTGTYEGGGPGDCEQWPGLLGISNAQTYAHAGVIFDTGFPIAGLTNTDFEGYFTLGSLDSDFFLLGNRSNVDPETGHAYYWGIWKYEDNLIVSFGAEAHHDSAEFTFDDEVSSNDLPISWVRTENPDYGSPDDEYGTEYIYEVNVGNKVKYAPAFDDRLEFFEGLNVCVFGRNSYEYPGEYGASAPSGSFCSGLLLSSIDGDDVTHSIALDPYIKNGTATLYKHYDIGDESVEGPLEPVLHEGAETYYGNFSIDYGDLLEIDPTNEEQHVATVTESNVAPYVTVLPVELEEFSEVVEVGGLWEIDAETHGILGWKKVTLDISIGGGGGSDWLVDALAGNITDLSGYSLPGSTQRYQYYYLLYKNNTIVNGPSFSDSSLNGNYGCAYMCQDCTALTDFDFSNVQEINGLFTCQQMFVGCTSLTNIDLSNLHYISGQGACNAMFSGCSSLTSIDLSELRTINGSGAVDWMLYGTQITSLDLSNLTSIGNSAAYDFLNNITELTINPTALNYSNQYLNVIKSGVLIEDLYFSTNATDNVYLLWQPNLTADSVLEVLTHLDLTVSGKSVNFYSSGLTVTDIGSSIQDAYDDAVAAGWTINNLTIVQP